MWSLKKIKLMMENGNGAYSIPLTRVFCKTSGDSFPNYK